MKTFNLIRHRTIKDALNRQLIKANNDSRLKSLCNRYMILAFRLQKMNLANGLKPRIDVTTLSFDSQFELLKAYREALIGYILFKKNSNKEYIK